MRILLDTSGWIEFLRRGGHREAAERVAGALRENLLVTAAPILVELLVGIDENTPVGTAAVGRIKAVEWVDASWETCVSAADIERTLRKKGLTVPTVDLMIAGIATVHDCAVWHFRDRHFSMIEDADGPRQVDLSRS